MKTIKIFALLLFFISASGMQAQLSDMLRVSGNDSYVDLGSQVGDGIRTIELWFKPDESITSELNEPITLVGRDGTNQNFDEFHLIFNPNIWNGNGGKLRFTCTYNINEHHSVYSENDFWERGQWHYVACVIHPIEGLLLFVDGVRQNDQNASFTTATANTSFNTTLGCWGDLHSRFFDGEIEDVRFSTINRYYNDFEPPCDTPENDAFTRGLYRFDGSINGNVPDLSSNNFDGDIVNAIINLSFVCPYNFIEGDEGEEGITEREPNLKIFPNPAEESLNVVFENRDPEVDYVLEIYDANGRRMSETNAPSDVLQVQVNALEKGTYFVVLRDKAGILIDREKMIKL